VGKIRELLAKAAGCE